ncbi:MAG: FkbM family methyltransferase [Elainellaceae cyanobacterium]
MDATETDRSYAGLYRQYLQDNQALQTPDIINQALGGTQWEDPQTTKDYRNVAVVALAMAEQADEIDLRSLYLEIASNALQSADGPISAAHRCLLSGLLEEPGAGQQTLRALLSLASEPEESSPLGLVYLPPTQPVALRAELLRQLWQAQSAKQQALLLTVEALRRSPLVFYNAQGLRFLQLAVAHYPQAGALQLQLGLALLFGGRVEGIVNLHRAQALAPQGTDQIAAAHQALHLAYRPISAPASARWREQAIAAAPADAQASPAWRWTQTPPESPITYVSFEGLTLAAEASLRSIVTSVLLGQGTWFEAELALWRRQLQPGMVVIDVGANVGVYTFSAARQVGRSGRVFAIEPFVGCVRCLQETCRINGLDWVTVCEAAASDRPGAAQLALRGSSELNELLPQTAEELPEGAAAVDCITLDGLVNQHRLERVDWIKIDAEGHELPVLEGARSLLEQFKPSILYENIAAGQGANLEVSRWLQRAGYRLYRYRPYLQTLEPVAALTETQGVLNLIALPDALSP